MPPQACAGAFPTSPGPLLPFSLFLQGFTQKPAFPYTPPRAAPPSSARAARLCKPVVSLLLARIKLGTRIFLLDSVPWDLGSRVFCTTSRRYRVTLKQPGRREGGCGSPVRTAEPGPRRNSPLPGKALTLPERNERKTEKRVN